MFYRILLLLLLCSYAEAKLDIEEIKHNFEQTMSQVNAANKEDIIKNIQTMQQSQVYLNNKEYFEKIRDKPIGNKLNIFDMEISELKEQSKISNLAIFISLSMPDNVIRQLNAEAEKLGANLVIRGMLDNDMAKTTKRVYELEASNVTIDPELFKKFEIQTVPTIVIYHKVCSECVMSTSSYDKVSGNITLNSALRLFSETGDLKSLAKEYLGVLES